MSSLRPTSWAALAVLSLSACQLGGAPSVGVDVQLLQLDGITDAVYTIKVVNADGNVVWNAPGLTSSAYGDGQGALSYVGPCDASSNPNTVELTIDDLPPLDPASWINPSASGPLVQTFVCEANRDARVDYDITILRDLDAGFVDIGVALSDIACSAKLDCVNGDEPLELLYDETGERGPTVVMGLACSGGPDADTHLYMSDVVLTCPGQAPVVVDVGTPGTSGPQPPVLFGSAVYQGVANPPSTDMLYWNVALGLEEGANGFAPGCTLTASATASDGPLSNATTPAGATYPVITWDVPITGMNGQAVCTEHPLGGPDSGVEVTYPEGTTTFPNGFGGDGGDPTDTGSVDTDVVDTDTGTPPTPNSRTVFITPQSYPADFGSTQFADSECRRWASTAGVAGTYRAVLCTDSATTAAAFAGPDVPIVNLGSSMVASSDADMLDGTLNTPIRFDVFGNPVPNDARYFTGCTPSGFPAPTSNSVTCDDWSATTGGLTGREARVGHPHLADSRWMDLEEQACSTQHRFLCLEI